MKMTKELLHKHVADIREMFTYMRPSGSETEQLFIDRYLTPLGFKRDPFKNLVVTVGEGSRILWSSHVDTVHRSEGRQTVHYDGEFLELSKRSKKRGANCLGADDTAGIWIMTEMVKAGVPGTYIIHHAEESGCVGSTDLAIGDPEFLKKFDFAIAFDRRGYDSIVTHQVGGRTCSDEFAQSFADILDAFHGSATGYKADDGGVYTDTNEYAHLIPECTNISVGYFSQHSKDERQNVGHLIWLKHAMVNCDWTQLTKHRNPEKKQSRFWGSNYGGRDFGYGGWDRLDDYEYGDLYDDKGNPLSNKSKRSSARSTNSYEDAVERFPEIAAEILSIYGLSKADFLAEVAAIYGDAYVDDEVA
jgi:hypothetical protein